MPIKEKNRYIGAKGTHFDPSQDFDASKGFDSEFKKGLKSVSNGSNPNEKPLLEINGRDLTIRPPFKIPTLTHQEYLDLGEEAKKARGDAPPDTPITDIVSPSIFDKANFYAFS